MIYKKEELELREKSYNECLNEIKILEKQTSVEFQNKILEKTTELHLKIKKLNIFNILARLTLVAGIFTCIVSVPLLFLNLISITAFQIMSIFSSLSSFCSTISAIKFKKYYKMIEKELDEMIENQNSFDNKKTQLKSLKIKVENLRLAAVEYANLYNNQENSKNKITEQNTITKTKKLTHPTDDLDI